MRRKIILSSLFFLAFVMTACGPSNQVPSTLVPQVPTVIGTAVIPITGLGTATSTAPSAITINPNSKLGPILVDDKGMTVYLYTMDSRNTSTCYGACSAIWPPVLTDGNPIAGSGVAANLLGITARNDGATQVTYNGHPLYYFAGDKAPGDTNGENVQTVWFAVTPQGNQK